MELSKLPTLKQVGRLSTAKLVRAGCKPIGIEYKSNGTPSTVTFSDGGKVAGSCLHCPNAPCMEYGEGELMAGAFVDFPADGINQVCPTNALEWPDGSNAPRVDADLCISCGLCVSRCPVAAIQLMPNGIASVNDQPNDYFQATNKPVSQELVDRTVVEFRGVPKRGQIFQESDESLLITYSKIEKVAQLLGPQFPNLLSRNLLLGLGVGTAIRRRGDTNIRMDMVLGPPGVAKGTGVVEFRVDGILDAPRNVLDNIAVLCSRYGFNKKDLVALVVTSALPNHRSEYWQLVRDVAEVLGIKIGSITWGALMVGIWQGARLRIQPDNEFYADSTSYSIRRALEGMLGRKLRLGQGYPGFVESPK